MQLRSAVITMNPRSYEATSDEFPDLLLQGRNLIISLQHLHAIHFKCIKSPLKLDIWFSRYRQTERFSSALNAQPSTQVDVFLRELVTF